MGDLCGWEGKTKKKGGLYIIMMRGIFGEALAINLLLGYVTTTGNGLCQTEAN
jgi:hypothetical protein